MADGYPVVVSFRTEDDSKNTHTDCVWLFRDITFNVPSGLGMKTNYRIYPFRSGGEATTVNVKAIPAIVAKTPYGHNPAKIHIWGSGQESHNTTWSTQKEMTWFEEVSDSYKLWYYSFESNTPTVNFQFIITNNGSDTGKTGDLDAKFKDNKYTYVDNGSVEIESSLPSAADVTISTNKTASGYYELPSSVYGARVIIRIGDKGLWIPVINRDYDYGYNGS